MNSKQFKLDLAGRELKVEIGQLANQANGAVLVAYGQTAVLATATMSRQRKETNYMPLMVNYEEKFYAAGKIKSGRFMKREGRATDDAVLTGRMIDRALRPCFDQRIRNEIQVVIDVLSFDKENDPDVVSLVAASLALSVSDIPWSGPVSAIRVGRVDNQFVLNPIYSQRELSDLDLVIASYQDKINMLEGSAKEVIEEDFIKAIEFGLSDLRIISEFQETITREVGQPKAILEIIEPSDELSAKVKKWLKDKLESAIYQSEKTKRQNALVAIEEEALKTFASDPFDFKTPNFVKGIIEEETDRIVHKGILRDNKRPDNRKLNQVRPISCQVGFLPRVHGSGLFNRGNTQALSVVTLGAPGDEQTINSMEYETTKRFMHHYNFPPFCTGETGNMFGPGRREIGHGALAEKALLPLMPNKEDFPYTIRIVSEILSSNGSSSMASVSGSSLALMDAGVPLKTHVSGMAMGLMSDESGNYKILTDIQGPEDHHGDMDCKIAGTKNGVTACQMDVKINGVSLDILKETFGQAREGRLGILAEMDKTISSSRPELSPLAPRIITLQINPEKIGAVIGPGGKVINEIIAKTNVKIDIEDSGLVSITSFDNEGGQKALDWVKSIVREVKPGEVFQGKVTRIIDFGAFVEILPNQEGMVHISELASYRVERVEDIVSIGQAVVVKVKNIDHQGRINLTLNMNDDGSSQNERAPRSRFNTRRRPDYR